MVCYEVPALFSFGIKITFSSKMIWEVMEGMNKINSKNVSNCNTGQIPKFWLIIYTLQTIGKMRF